jgi:RNA polymerase sigma factor (sigma-70 family)
VPLADAASVKDDALAPDELAVVAEQRRAVREAVVSLSPRYRRVIELSMRGLGPAEIGRAFGIKRNAADAIIHRARRALASKL